MITPDELKAKFPLNDAEQRDIAQARATIADIIHGRDDRLLIVCGPCSIHDTDAALEYARRLQSLAAELNDRLYIVMRVYLKPRTTVGWKGLINDPFMDGSFDVESGLHIARGLLLELVNMGLPLATEALDPNSPQYRAIYSVGQLSAHVQRNHKRTVRWPPACPCLLGSKTVRMAARERRSTR